MSVQPSRGVQPIMSQTFARAVVVKATSDPRTVLTKARLDGVGVFIRRE